MIYMEEIKKEPVTVGLILTILLYFSRWNSPEVAEHEHMLDCGAAYTPMIVEGGEYYRLFTCMFLHFGIEHLLNNMLVLFVLGSRLERVIGRIKFLIIYLVGGLLGNVISVLVELKSMDFAVSAGASGAVFAVMGAMIYIVIRNKGWLGDLSARQILVMAFFSLYYGFTSTGVDNTAHVAGLVLRNDNFHSSVSSERQKNIKGCSFTGYTFDAERPMVCFDDLSGDSKPETCAAGLVRYERKKDLFRLLGSHATAIVMDGDLDSI